MNALYVSLAVLATYRAARMIALEDGPFDVFSRLQERAGGQKTWLGRGLACPLCVGFWIAALPAIYLAASGAEFALLWFGIAGGAAVLHRVIP